jgi:hypothetical protein
METYEVAHIHEQGQDMIIIPVQSSFGQRPTATQNEIVSSLQLCASAAGLKGTVVPVWDAGGGRMGFLAPTPWHPFFRSIDLQFVARNINRKLTCG